MGFIGLLNALLKFLFPFWPWEVFICYPLALEMYLRKATPVGEEGDKDTVKKLILVYVFAIISKHSHQVSTHKTSCLVF